VQTQWKPAVDWKRLTFEVNGKTLSNPTRFFPKNDTSVGWSEFETRALQKGVNQFEIKLDSPSEGHMADRLVLQELRVSITYA